MIVIRKLNDLYASIISDLQAEFGVTISPVGKVLLRAFAMVQAGKLKLYYLVIGSLQKNIWPDTADPESMGGTLERFGRVKLGRNLFPATAAQYELTITGTVGGVIRAQTTFKSDDTSLNPGYLFILDQAYTLVASTDTITVRALTPGVESKLDILDTLTATAPIALVDKGAYVSSEVVPPIDAETTEQYRAKTLNAFRLETQGGAATDYRLWAGDAPGVATVYPYAKSGEQGAINLFIEATAASSTDGKGTPPGYMLADVEAVVDFDPDTTLPLNDRGRRPINAKVYYLPVVVRQVDIVIAGYTGITTDIQSLILSAMTDAISSVRPFISAADILSDKNDIIDVNKLIAIIIGQQPGAVFTGVTLKIDGVSVSTYTFTDGNIPYLNSVTYT